MARLWLFYNTLWWVLLLRPGFLCHGFLVAGTQNSRRTIRITRTTGLRSSSNHQQQEVFVVAWDGCLADTVAWRSQVGLQAAVQAWPEEELEAVVAAYPDPTWLYNKLAAIAHVLCGGTGARDNPYSTTCEFALAARLLLEEQKLDNGGSNGIGGKYASRFHPRKAQNSDNDDWENKNRRKGTRRNTSNRNSRPLTVGEIASNWAEGGMIRDALQIRYHCNYYEDPMPVLQAKIDALLSDEESTAEQNTPSLLEAIRDAVLHACQDSDRQLIVTVGHTSELQTAKASLEGASIDCRLASSVSEALGGDGDSGVDGIALLVQSKDTIRDIVEESSAGTTVYVVNSCWKALQESVPLYGDYIPRQNSVGKCFAPRKYLSLCLPAWSSHLTQQGAATMNPWTHLLSRTEFKELVSARVLSSWD